MPSVGGRLRSKPGFWLQGPEQLPFLLAPLGSPWLATESALTWWPWPGGMAGRASHGHPVAHQSLILLSSQLVFGCWTDPGIKK